MSPLPVRWALVVFAACIGCTTSGLDSLTGGEAVPDAGAPAGGAPAGGAGGAASVTGTGATGAGLVSGSGGTTTGPDASLGGGGAGGGSTDASIGGASGGGDGGLGSGGSGGTPGDDGTAIGTVGQPCSVNGAYVCAGHAQKGQLVCVGGTWTPNGTCVGSENCDTTPGSNAGSCQPIAASCVGVAAGTVLCQGADSVECGIDLVTTTRLETCPFVCALGACVGGCLPGTRQCNGFAPENCDATGAWTDDAPCPKV